MSYNFFFTLFWVCYFLLKQSATLILNLWFAWAEDSSMNYEAGRAEVEQVNQGAAGERRLQESSN